MLYRLIYILITELAIMKLYQNLLWFAESLESRRAPGGFRPEAGVAMRSSSTNTSPCRLSRSQRGWSSHRATQPRLDCPYLVCNYKQINKMCLNMDCLMIALIIWWCVPARQNLPYLVCNKRKINVYFLGSVINEIGESIN